MSKRRVDMDRLQELVRLHRMGTGAREVARMLRMSPNTERDYRQALEKEGLLDGPVIAGWVLRKRSSFIIVAGALAIAALVLILIALGPEYGRVGRVGRRVGRRHAAHGVVRAIASAARQVHARGLDGGNRADRDCVRHRGR